MGLIFMGPTVMAAGVVGVSSQAKECGYDPSSRSATMSNITLFATQRLGVLSSGTSVAGGYMSVSPIGGAGTTSFRALSKSNAAAATIQGDCVRLSSSLSRELFIKCKWTRREKAS